ncbi:MAG: type II toxin-antitoxin system HicA family toxin [Planctomycetota bacterium]|jgi:predicted RNA binding protein YcfA (HicA-like mRNA interferase family)
MAKRLSKCRKGKEFIKYARRKGAEIRSGRGSHHIVSTDKGSCVVPVHAKELGKGLLCKIVKTFKLIGLAVFVAILIANGLP